VLYANVGGLNARQEGKSRVQFEHPHDDHCGSRVLYRPGAKINPGPGVFGVMEAADREVNPVVRPGVGLLPTNKLHLHFFELQSGRRRVITMTPAFGWGILLSHQLCCQQLS